jgi:hypothetical protein
LPEGEVVQVNIPDGGQSYTVGEKANIHWVHAGTKDITLSYRKTDGSWSDPVSIGTGLEEGYHSYAWTVPADAIGTNCKVRLSAGTEEDESDDSDGEITIENRAPHCPSILSIDGWEEGTEMATVDFDQAGDPDGQACTYTVYMGINADPIEPVDLVDGKVNIPKPDDLNSQTDFALHIRSDDGAGGWATTGTWSGEIAHDGNDWILRVFTDPKGCVESVP